MYVKMPYIGARGFTIFKSELNDSEREEIRRELTVKPVVPKMALHTAVSFPIYKESVQKMYMPIYWGLSRFPTPCIDIRLPLGDNICLPFAGQMRDYQQAIVSKYMNHVEKCGPFGGGLFDVMTGSGKTVMALNIISQMKKKTLIIVHKSFLLNQWLERIEQFLPDARVGRIQGECVDIDNKDIVIGMLQSLSMKEYHENTFKSFGLLICDEVHHLSAEVFVRALQCITTRYTLGLSATMQRKDGLSKVFKMFLGDILHKDKRTNEHEVLVHACHFKTNDPEFNQVKHDWRGNPMYSVMISRLCAYEPRSLYILSLIHHVFATAPSSHLMVLAHNKSLLVYLYKSIQNTPGSPTVGYYLGGMKEKDLKLSEDKQIILATYAMASEGLDIKTLTTLIMATPKTDVTQSVGRILRTKDHQPVVYDVVDEHGLFQGQWRKRNAFYKKSGYQVQHSNSDNLQVTAIATTAGHHESDDSESESDVRQTETQCFLKTKKSI